MTIIIMADYFFEVNRIRVQSCIRYKIYTNTIRVFGRYRCCILNYYHNTNQDFNRSNLKFIFNYLDFKKASAIRLFEKLFCARTSFLVIELHVHYI